MLTIFAYSTQTAKKLASYSNSVKNIPQNRLLMTLSYKKHPMSTATYSVIYKLFEYSRVLQTHIVKNISQIKLKLKLTSNIPVARHEFTRIS
jgi:hypothetical protein